MIELKPKRPKQNQHHSKKGYKYYQNTDIHITGTNAKKERKPFKKCTLCEEKRRINNCERYKAMNVLEKINTEKANKLC